jgi:DNA (cytosine-5)-methyltransferase 1
MIASSDITVTDLFAGAGGSSTGAALVPGVRIRVASNHWQLACDVHGENHVAADHICADLSQISPRYFPHTEILWASPECTNHSRARGRRAETAQPDLFGETLPAEAAERSRATMWDVVRFSEQHAYSHVIVENVVEAAQWLPFRSWLSAMESLGYAHHIVYLNSMHAQTLGVPAPQSRDRIYANFWRRTNTRPDFEGWLRPKAWCPTCDQVVDAIQSWKKPDQPWGRYRQQYVYRCPHVSCRNQVVEPGWLPAAAAIDWTLRGTRIGDRDRPLSDKTRRRIAAGIARYWSPLQLEAAGHTYDAADTKHPQFGDPNSYYRIWPTDQPLKTIHATGSKALAIPVEGRDGKVAIPAGMPLRTMTTRAETGLVRPFIAELRGGGSTARPSDHPLATVTASGFHHGLVVPSEAWTAEETSVGERYGTIATGDALLTPYYGNSDAAAPTDRPIGTLTTRDRYALIVRQNGTKGNLAWASTPVGETFRTLTTKGQQAVLTPGELAAAEAQVDDCEFRMLEPTETAAGMAFPSDYRWQGTRRERQKLAGNAVTPPAARDLIGCAVEALTGETSNARA